MAGERQTLWAGAATAVATIAAVAICGFVLWNLGTKQRAQFVAELSALNAKIDKTHATVAEIQKKSTLEDTGKALGALNADIRTTNARLVELQQASSLRGSEAQSQAGEAHDKALARLDTAINELKSAIASTTAAQTAALQKIAATVDSIKSTTEAVSKQTSEQVSIQNKDAAKSADKDAVNDLMVVYVATPSPAAADTTASIPGKTPLSVRFEKIGSTNANGQTKAVVAELRKIINGRHDCAISVAGYADTLGSDAVNLDVSRERAEAVAAGLKTAFANEGVEVKKAAWGERQLKVWTPDNRSEKANRRVDVSVECKR